MTTTSQINFCNQIDTSSPFSNQISGMDIKDMGDQYDTLKSPVCSELQQIIESDDQILAAALNF